MSVIRSIWKFVSRLLMILGIAGVTVALLLLDFLSRTNAENVDGDLPSTAIVFTGDFDRIRAGLELLATSRVERLFITGVNGDAGLNVARFSEQFELDPRQAEWLTNGQIVLAPDAHSTLENALEAACWLERQPDVDAVALVTSRVHMARASVALQHGAAPVSVVPAIADPLAKHDLFRIDLIEFGKFAATWFATLLPKKLWPAEVPQTCRSGEMNAPPAGAE